METAARTPANAIHKEPAPVEPLVPGPTMDTNTTNTTSQDQSSAGYLQTARETLASIAGTVQNAVGIETPASTLHSIADNTKINASMPSSETSGVKPGERVGGVGALPGDNKEEGVARLPAERTSVPSREHEGAYPGEKSGGVGALPGHLNESNVAVLPEERGTSATQTKEGVESSARAALHPTSAPLASVHPTSTHPTSAHLASTHPTSEHTTSALPTSTHSTSTHPTAEHPKSTFPTAEHPTSEHTDKTDVKTAAAHPIATAKQARRDSTSSSSSSDGERDPNAPKRKTTLKNKVAGGMKTAMGKLKKDEEMIAEGQAQRGH